MERNQRKQNLIRAGLQLKITLVFLTMSIAMAVLMGYLILVSIDGLAIGNAEVLPIVMPALLNSFWITIAVLIPATILVGVLATFLVAGPLHRIELFLNALIDGKRPGDCKLRDGDELQSFCALVNRATAPLRVAQDGDEGDRADAA